jgi:hypothetical protein
MCRWPLNIYVSCDLNRNELLNFGKNIKYCQKDFSWSQIIKEA